MKPKISVITAVYNGEAHIESTIQSVAALRDVDYEYIVIDGGSSDNTTALLKKHASTIHYWISEPDKGIYDAFNKGWRRAAIDSYIVYLGAGDRLISLPEPSAWEGADVIYGDVMMDGNRTFHSKADFRLKLGNTLHHQALLVKKSVHPEPPFDIAFRTYADFDFNQRLLKQGVRFKFDKHFLAYALPGGVSDKFKTDESLRIVQKNFGAGYAGLARVYYGLQKIKTFLIQGSEKV